MIYIIIIAVILYLLLKRNGSNRSTGGAGAARPAAGPKRSAIVNRVTGKVVTSFVNGIVYYADTDSPMGRYDAQGHVYDQSGRLIGMSYPEGDVVMDRTYNYTWLQNNLSGDSAVRNPRCKPAMTMLAGRNYGTYIEAPEGMTDIYITTGNTDFVGAGAAYLIAVNDDLINEELAAFYLTQNVQSEVYFIAKNGRGMPYYNEFKARYGFPWYRLD